MKKEKIIDKLLNEIFPSNLTCDCCGEELNQNDYLCENCKKNLIKIKNKCKKCGDEVNDFTHYCKFCKGIKRDFTTAVSSFMYDGTAKSLVYKLKYGGAKYIAKPLAKYLVETFKNSKLQNIDIVTCVPLNSKRLKTRGYNQAQVLAEEFCKWLSNENINIAQNYQLIKRVKNTPTQTSLTKVERQENLKDAFEFCGNTEEIKNKNILIIDDIFTTGATMEELSKIFKKHKAGKIYCLTCCHTVKTLNNVKINEVK